MCLTLSDPKDCNIPGFPVLDPRYILSFSYWHLGCVFFSWEFRVRLRIWRYTNFLTENIYFKLYLRTKRKTKSIQLQYHFAQQWKCQICETPGKMSLFSDNIPTFTLKTLHSFKYMHIYMSVCTNMHVYTS